MSAGRPRKPTKDKLQTVVTRVLPEVKLEIAALSVRDNVKITHTTRYLIELGIAVDRKLGGRTLADLK